VTGKRAPGGSLTVVGTGIRAGLDTTAEARLHIERGDPLLYLVNDPVTEGWLRRLNPGAATLADAYRDGAPRLDAYREMADRILAAVRAGGAVCVAFYGHPGIFVRPGHEAVRRAAAEGYPTRMVPGVSAEDWLFADLGVDPADRGCQSFEATDFLLYRRRFDPRSALVLWQVGGTGDRDFRRDGGYRTGAGVRLLAERLAAAYPPGHRAIVYEAGELPVGGPRIEPVALSELPAARLTARSTLYVPPADPGEPDAETTALLGLDPGSL
jgi:hypothetical protein